ESDLSPDERRALCLGAELVVHDRTPLPEIAPLDALGVSENPRPERMRARRAAPVRPRGADARLVRRERLDHFNGYGGFAPGGEEYVIRLRPRAGGGLQRPPAPWINVLANETFGALVSETGAGATWSRNSREHRL